MENQTNNTSQTNGPFNSDNIVPLEEAVARVAAYREYAEPLFSAGNMPKAILIPLADVQEIIERFNNSSVTQEEGLSGIRIYFSMLPDDPEDLEVRGLVVPVREDGTDIIIPEEEGESSIYDFTKPCPKFCDLTSPLYSA